MRARDFGASKHYGSLKKNYQKFIVDECASHMTLFCTGIIIRACCARYNFDHPFTIIYTREESLSKIFHTQFFCRLVLPLSW